MLSATADAESCGSSDISEYIVANWLKPGDRKKEGINTNTSSLLFTNFQDSNS